MTTTRFPRLEAIFGVEMDSLTAAHFAEAVASRLEESQDLDFKRQMYGTADRDKRDLATDVAAMANAIGGLIVVGIGEEDGHAAVLNPIELTEDVALRLERTIASNVFPTVSNQILRVSSGARDETGFYLILIPRSSLAPHGVAVNEGFRYPLRSGRSNRYLSESEIANAYRNRFELALSRAGRIEDVEEDGVRQIDSNARVWLTQAVVPDRPGSMEISHGRPVELRNWLAGLDDGPTDGRPSFIEIGGIDVRPRRRRVTLSSGLAYSEFHTDGSSFLASVIGWDRRRIGAWEGDPTGVPISDELLATKLLAHLRIAAHHAIENARTSGDCLVRVRIDGAVSFEGNLLERNKHLVHDRRHRGHLEVVRNTIAVPSAMSEVTLNLEDLYEHPSGWVSGARAIMTDLVQTFGLAEPYQFNERGEIRSKYFSGLAPWADDLGIGGSDEVLP